MYKLGSIFCIFVVICVANGSHDDEEAWSHHMKKHGLQFSCPHKHNNSKAIFLQKKKYVENHNKRFNASLETYSVALNQYSHMDKEELEKRLLGFKPKSNSKRDFVPYNVNYNGVLLNTKMFKSTPGYVVPSSFSWLDKCTNIKVKNQNPCGCCWAHAATTTLEFNFCSQKNINIQELSPQQLIDCTSSYGNNGCNGGASETAFEYIRRNPSIALTSESSYSFTSGSNGGYTGAQCLTSNMRAPFANIQSLFLVDQNEAAILEALVKFGPLAVGIYADVQALSAYNGGIYNGVNGYCPPYPNHAVTLVGYTEKYYLIQNSWGKDMNVNGFIYLARLSNKCGINTSVSGVKL